MAKQKIRCTACGATGRMKFYGHDRNWAEQCNVCHGKGYINMSGESGCMIVPILIMVGATISIFTNYIA